uniref:Fledgling of Klp38B, isoform E n=1 Tax=Drosophila melanogaster TaxID=7227 RepID=M9MRX2_DROME|nr:fledgling of Klp38B, isoform E [Drosophila melanogaster]ADV37103.1 fledgling of Klp38B, isoform E [Drosophila melanogaster]|eukprot:NP_001188854.1 fledgling of Klp38B, isoform E [Drosophila melanogaster]
MLNRLLQKLKSSRGVKSQALKDGKKLSKGNCKCEPSACKCGKRQQRQQQLKLLVSQLRRRDNVSSVIMF